MPSKRAIPVLVITATAVALAAITIPALAGTGRTPGPPQSSDEPPAVDAVLGEELLAALQRDLGLDPAEVPERLSREAWATQTAAALRAELGEERYAGAWLAGGADTLKVAVTDQAAADVARAAGAEPELVQYAEQDLARAMRDLDGAADRAAEPVSGWYVDWPSNSIVVLAPDWAEADAWEFVTGTLAPDGTVRVIASDERPQLLNDVRGGDPYIIDNSARCSVGFSVVGGFVTAGHCALAGVSTSGADGTPQGQFVAASFPGVGQDGPDDWGVVAVNDDWFPQPVVNDFAGGTLPVAGAQEAPVGAAVCKSGSTTGVSCGVVEAKNATVRYPEGTVTGLTRTSACAEPGDSGGAWLAGDQAQGVTSGGSGDCTNGGVTFFQPLVEILELNNLTLLTTGDGDEDEPPPAEEEPPPAEEEAPATGACDRHDHRFTGRLSGTGDTQAQPDGRFYRSLSTGTHTVCLAGPRQADFDLALQRWDGSVFQTLAVSGSFTSNELIVFHASAGFYRIVVTSLDGGGQYVVGLSFASSG